MARVRNEDTSDDLEQHGSTQGAEFADDNGLRTRAGLPRTHVSALTRATLLGMHPVIAHRNLPLAERRSRGETMSCAENRIDRMGARLATGSR